MPFIRDKNIRFTQSNDEKAIYAFITKKRDDEWKYGQRTEFLFPMIEGTAATKVEVLGYGSKLLEYVN